MATLPPPLNVNPVIKLARWTLLILGIRHGSKRQKKLEKREVKIREAYLKKKKIRDEQLAKQKSLDSARDIAMLASLAEPAPDYMRYYSPPPGGEVKATPKPEPKHVETPPSPEVHYKEVAEHHEEAAEHHEQVAEHHDEVIEHHEEVAEHHEDLTEHVEEAIHEDAEVALIDDDDDEDCIRDAK